MATKPTLVKKKRKQKEVSSDQVQELLSRIKGVDKFSGVEQKAEEDKVPKLSLLQRVGKGLSAFETGNAVYKSMYEGKDFLSQYGLDIKRKLKAAFTGRREENPEEEKTYKDILLKKGFYDKKGRIDPIDIVGFGLDVVADPTTIFGGAIGKGIKATTKTGVKLARTVPFIDDVVGGLKRAFSPEIVRVADEIGQFGDKTLEGLKKKFIDSTTRWNRGGTITINNTVSELSKLEKTVRKTIGEDNLPKIIDSIETGIKTGNKLIDEQADLLKEFYSKRLSQVKDSGLKIGERELFQPHIVTDEYLALKRKTIKNPSAISKPARVKLGTGIERKFTSWIDESGNRVYGNIDAYDLKRSADGLVNKNGQILEELPVTVREANEWSTKELGVKLFEDNPYKAQAKYFIDTEKALRTDAYLKEIKNMGMAVEDGIEEFIDDAGMRWVKSTAPGLEKTLLPEPVAKYIDSASKILSSDEAAADLLQAYDKIMNIWKGSVYGWFPSSHTTNIIGGLFHNYVAGAVAPKWYLNTERILQNAPFEDVITKGDDIGKKLGLKQIKKELDEYGVIGESGYLDVPENLKSLPGKTGAFEAIGKAPAKFMGHIEDRLRIPLYLDGRFRLGLTPQEAADRVIKFHFDYSPHGLSAIERKVIKRVIPFYTFTRNAVPLNIEQMILHPAKYAAVFKAQKASGLTPDDEEVTYLPKYLQQQIGLKVGDKYRVGFKLPFEETIEFVETPLRSFVSSTAPTYKIPIELATGKNIFKDIDIDKDVNGYAFKDMPGFMKEFLEYTEVVVPKNEDTGREEFTKYYVNPFKRYAVENFPFTSRALSTIRRVLNGDTTTEKASTLFSAIKDYELSEVSRKSIYEKNLLEELQSMLERLGGGYYYTRYNYSDELKEPKKRTKKTPLKIKK